MSQGQAIVDTKERAAAVVHLVVPCADMATAMPPAIHELLTALAGQGLAPCGPMFTHHLRMPTDVFDFEVGFPVAGAFVANGRVKPGLLPAATVARTVYCGPYEGLGGAWRAFTSSLPPTLEAASLKPAGDFWEIYLVGPESVSDASEFQTELNLRLCKK